MLPTIATGNVGSALAGEFEVANSLRFDDGSSDELHRTPSGAGNKDAWTLSMWVKRGLVGSGGTQSLYGVYADSDNQETLAFDSGGNIDKLYWQMYQSGSVVGQLTTNRLFRDPSAWYNIVISYDSANATAGNRMRMWINGIEETSFATDTNPSSGLDSQWNGTTKHQLGCISSTNYFDGYMAEVVSLDGTAVTDATSFGEFDEDTGIWKPIDVSGLTFGTNGFYLDFENSGSLGADVSSNGNNFTVNNLTSDDQMIDTPTNNFCTLNPLFRGGTVGETLEEGNLFYDSNYNKENFVCATQSVSTGKWYFEILPDATDTHGAYGFTNADNLLQTTSLSTSPYDLGIGASIRPDGNGSPDYKINTTSTSISVTTTSVFGIALDADTGDIEFFENNVSVGSGTITGITNYIPFANCHSQSASRKGIATFNFGQDSSFAGSKTRQNNTDNNGQGDFYYAPPSGYYALNTKNLAEYG